MTETSSTTTGEPAPSGCRGEGSSQRRGGERSETPRSGEAPSPRPDELNAAIADRPHDRGDVGVGGARDVRPDPQVLEKPTRRRFTAQYKRRILEEADACSQPGQIGALFRREGLYSSLLSAWRRERDKALSEGLGPRKRGRRAGKNPLAERVARLERDNARLRRELEQAKLIIDIQKKTSQLLGIERTDVSQIDTNPGDGESE